MTGFAEEPDLDLLAHETDQLMETVHGLSDEDVRQDTLCPGWSRAHVLTHIARNADGLRNVLRAAAQGGDGAFYESQAARNRDIEDGSGRRAAELEADVETSADHLLEALAEFPAEALDVAVPRLRVNDDPDHQFMIPGRKVPALRLREVVYHHIDLATGYSFARVSPTWVARELAESARRFTTAPAVELDAGDVGSWRYGREDEEPVTVSGAAADLLAWVTGRGTGAGLTSSSGRLPELGPWG